MLEDLKFHHTLPIQLRFTDVDKFGHVNNNVYFTYYDLGKTAYFSTVYPSADWNRDAMVVVHIEADFISQILGTDTVAVQTAVLEIGNKSMTIIQRVINTHTNEVKCYCKSIMVAFSMETHDSIEIPEDWKEAVTAFERRDVRKKK
ncbi:thioesterase family protein [Bacteroides sp. 519]|uniref:acyl-CoA thioesterase n=1 Tax=Bacteroides sp. 519 TaxID=2302937 RepID=UPI0013D480F0|nr:thioesterase family protein [Bacteroides sp. 519]NDV57883.1 acyl-CoA thioesterase [Bacteroides sp. 519]